MLSVLCCRYHNMTDKVVSSCLQLICAVPYWAAIKNWGWSSKRIQFPVPVQKIFAKLQSVLKSIYQKCIEKYTYIVLITYSNIRWYKYSAQEQCHTSSLYLKTKNIKNVTTEVPLPQGGAYRGFSTVNNLHLQILSKISCMITAFYIRFHWINTKL